jgi:hypothetical protein
MPVNYGNGKIYKITSPSCDLVYIGSTTQPLCVRLSKHKDNYKQFQKGQCRNVSSFEIIKYRDAVITLIEAIPCNSKEELFRAERRYIEQTNCVNKYRPIVSKEEMLLEKKEYYQANADQLKEKKKEYYQANAYQLKEKMKEYYQANADHIKKRVKEYEQANADQIKEQKKEYRQANAVQIKEKKKEYYQANAEQIKEQMKEHYQANADKKREYASTRVVCDKCQCSVIRGGLARHKKSKKCLNFTSSTTST